MTRAILIAGLLVGQVGSVCAAAADRPGAPAWATDDRACAWNWTVGGGIGFWSETCTLGTGTWDIAWDARSNAFWQRRDGVALTRVVVPWSRDPGRGIGQMIAVLQGADDLAQDSDCTFQPDDTSQRSGDVVRYRLAPATDWPAETLAGAEVPDDPCGPYGISAGAHRYVQMDPRWPDRAVFIDAGQERPMFDPDSIVAVP